MYQLFRPFFTCSHFSFGSRLNREPDVAHFFIKLMKEENFKFYNLDLEFFAPL